MNEIALSAALPEITPDLFTTGTAVIGIRGSGKTNDGVVIAEQAIRYGVPTVVVDPTGVWFGLRSSADGKSAGLPVYVFGGAHGDVPLDPSAGTILARFVVDRRVPIVLDLSDMTKGQQRRFVGEFMETLYDLKARQRDPLLVILDEAARFVPQGMVKGDFALTKCIGAVEDIVALGRSRGLGCVLIGQRPATINKNVLTQADNLIAMRTVGAQDRKALDEWVSEMQGDQRERDEMMGNLAGLPQGEGYFWSPAIFGVFRRVKFAARTTFDSSRTPKVGEKRVEPTAFASVNLDELRGEIAASVERAKEDDPKALRARIAELEKRGDTAAISSDLQAMQRRAEAAEADMAAAEAQRDTLAAISRKLIEATRASTRTVMSAIEGLVRDIDRISDGIAPSETAQGGARDSASIESAGIKPSAPGKRDRGVVASVATALPRVPHSSAEPGAVGGGPMRMLNALAGTKDGRATRTQLGMLSGYVASGGGFRNNLSALRIAGHIIDEPNAVALTAAGANAATPTPMTSRDVIDMWLAKCAGGPRKMLQALVDAYPEGMTRAELGNETGYEASGGGFRNNLSGLRTKDLISERNGLVYAALELFPTGRPR